MAEPLHLQPDQGPETEQLRLGDQVIETDRDTARAVMDYVQSMAAQYGASLEEYRRQALATVGTQQPAPQMPQIPGYDPETGLPVPDPDLLFRDKNAWSQGLGQSIQSQIGQVRSEVNQTAQGLAQAFQQELARRDAVAQAKAIHDTAMEAMLERRGLSDNTRIVQAIYNEQYDKLKHLPLELGLDKIGQLAEEEIQRIRSGEKWEMRPAGTQTGVAPRAPARHLRSTQRAAAPAPPREPEGLQEPGGGLGMMGKIIRTRQAKVLGGSSA